MTLYWLTCANDGLTTIAAKGHAVIAIKQTFAACISSLWSARVAFAYKNTHAKVHHFRVIISYKTRDKTTKHSKIRQVKRDKNWAYSWPVIRGSIRGNERNAIPTSVCKCNRPADFFSYSERLYAKLQTKLTVSYKKVLSFRMGGSSLRSLIYSFISPKAW